MRMRPNRFKVRDTKREQNRGSTVNPHAAGGPLAGRHIVLGVSGSIAAYKAAEVASRLVQGGTAVDVAMTRGATEFITPLTFRALTGREPYVDIFRDGAEGEAHVELARRADLLLIAPASATTLARLAHGLAEDFVSLTALATRAPVLVAPAMDAQMWEHAATQANLDVLRSRGVHVVNPDEGYLACGMTGAGRLAGQEQIVAAVREALRFKRDLEGQTVLITAGASAPEERVQECVVRLAERYGAHVESRTVREEHVSFPLPRELRVLTPSGC